MDSSLLQLAASALAVPLHALPDGVQIWDHRGVLSFVNQTSADQLGCSEYLTPGAHWHTWLGLFRTHGGLPCDESEFPIALALQNAPPALERPFQVRTEEGQTRWFLLRAQPIPAAVPDEILGVISTTTDVSQLIEQANRLKQEAHFDKLTGLPNRTLFADRIRQATVHSKRTGNLLGVCLMDLDGFKAVNDRLGHKAGDQLLQEVARRLQSILGPQDTAARLGGDEFALLLTDLAHPGESEQVLKRILVALSAPCTVAGEQVRISASIGVTLSPLDPSEPEQLMRHADQAMYRAKQAGKNCFDAFNQTLESKVRANQTLLRKIEQALENGDFRLHYQPKVNCREGKVIGLEALIRWHHPVLGIRSPGEFLPLIEQDNLIIRLGEWVVNAAMQQLQTLHAAGFPLSISINIAAHQFLYGNFCERLSELLARYPAELTRFLEIEILESAALEDVGQVTQLIQQHRCGGVRFSLDDFGTGYSSLAHLKHLPVDTLKIDQTFVRDMLNDSGDLTIVQAVIGLAGAFQRQVVAEGAESIEQVLMLLALGCDVLQGYVFARPLPEDQLMPWLTAFQADPRWSLADSSYPTQADFQLLLIESDHRHRFDQVLSMISGYPWPRPPVDHDCRFQTWVHDSWTQKRYGDQAEFKQLESAHRDYVYVLDRALAEPNPAPETLLHLRQVHDMFIALLNAFRLRQTPSTR